MERDLGTWLLRNEQVELCVVPERELVSMTRLAATLPADSEGLEAFYSEVAGAMADLDRPRLDLLVDSRKAVGRHDPEFERVQAAWQDALFGGFRCVAVVLRTIAGHLQLSRYALESPELRTACFTDPDEALRFLEARRSVRLPDVG